MGVAAIMKDDSEEIRASIEYEEEENALAKKKLWKASSRQKKSIADMHGYYDYDGGVRLMGSLLPKIGCDKPQNGCQWGETANVTTMKDLEALMNKAYDWHLSQVDEQDPFWPTVAPFPAFIVPEDVKNFDYVTKLRDLTIEAEQKYKNSK